MQESTYNNPILQSISDGVFTIDQEWRISSFNRSAENITGIIAQEALGKKCFDIFKSSLCEDNCPLKQTFETGEPVIDKSCFFQNVKNELIPVSVSSAILKDNDGHIIGGAETFRDLSEIQSLKEEVIGIKKIGDFESRSPAMFNVFQLIKAAAPTPSNILILGNTGVGKEIVARTIHQESDRSKEPWLAVNCSALPENLLESELFGHIKGSFTGAYKNKDGLFKQAGSGTIFLDEIGDISSAMQLRLLRVLQEREFTPVGSSAVFKTKARIIAATNRDLKERIKNNLFREDLYYRLNVIRIEIPSLNERKEDIPQLAHRFLKRFSVLYKKQNLQFSSEALALLQQYPWPGNVRELENVIERICIVCSNSIIKANDFPEEFDDVKSSDDFEILSPLKSIRSNSEKSLIEEAIVNSQSKSAAAKKLGIHKATLYRKIKSLKIEL